MGNHSNRGGGESMYASRREGEKMKEEKGNLTIVEEIGGRGTNLSWIEADVWPVVGNYMDIV